MPFLRSLVLLVILALAHSRSAYCSHITPWAIEYIKAEVLPALGDSSADVRRALSSVVTSIVTHLPSVSHGWPELVPFLVQLLSSGNLDAMDGAFMALNKVCEDSASKLDDGGEEQPINMLVSGLVLFLA